MLFSHPFVFLIFSFQYLESHRELVLDIGTETNFPVNVSSSQVLQDPSLDSPVSHSGLLRRQSAWSLCL